MNIYNNPNNVVFTAQKIGNYLEINYSDKNSEPKTKRIVFMGRAHKNLIKENYTELPEGYKIKNGRFIKNEYLKAVDRLQKIFDEAEDLRNHKKRFNFKLPRKITEEQMTRILLHINKHLVNKKREVLRVKDVKSKKWYYISKTNREEILNEIKNNQVIKFESYGSDQNLKFLVKKSNNIVFDFKNITGPVKLYGGFFNYFHKIDGVDLSRYGIFREDQEKDYSINCLYRALMVQGMSEEKLNVVKSFCKNRDIPKCKLKYICKKLNIEIKLRYESNSGTRAFTFGKGNDEKYKIGLLNNHYFSIDKEANVTTYCLKNHEKIRQLKNWKFIYCIKKGRYTRNKKKTANSYVIITALLKNKESLLTPISLDNKDIMKSQFYNKTKKIVSLNYSDDLTRKIETYNDGFGRKFVEGNSQNFNRKNFVEPLVENVITFDFETTTDGKYHEAYMVSKYDGVKATTYYTALDFLNSIEKDSILLAHNAGYDFRQVLGELTKIMNVIERGTRTMEVRAMFYNRRLKKMIKIIIKDTYCMITMPLKNFGKSFELEQQKEIMPYGAYNTKTIKSKKMRIKTALKYLKESERVEFIENLKKLNMMTSKKTFDHMKYAKYYCEMDCKVLYDGYMKFREWMKDITGIEILGIISSASLADNYFRKMKCYTGCYELSGHVREFIQRCIVGGKCMTRKNKKYHIKEELNDFDGVSLYPSSMYRLGGYLKGKPKVIDVKSYDFIKNKDGYFVEIKIKKVNKKYAFPLISQVENGIRVFKNDINPNDLYYVDKIGLEDLINFHDIEFEIIRGYYYNEGRNYNIKKTIKFLFDERSIKKSQDNPVEKLYKLLMNSAYGKTIMKPIDSEKRFFNTKQRKDQYIRNNYNFIKSVTKINKSDKYIVKSYKTIDTHFSSPHIGCEILSMSKRIMNEVMCLAEDHKIKIYYQDTDSMHIQNNKIELLRTEYRKKYNRELIGKYLGQFHCDFNMEGAENIVSIESIFLGKKCYIDKLVGYKKQKKNEKNKKKEKVYGHHVRMKGVGSKVVEKYDKDVFTTYKRLLNGEEIEFDLMSVKVKFENLDDYSVKTREEFKRRLKF
jgi:hypothetical protein